MVFESRVTWATSEPILVFLGLSVLDLGPMYAIDRRQTTSSLNAPPIRGGGIKTSERMVFRRNGLVTADRIGIIHGRLFTVKATMSYRPRGRRPVPAMWDVYVPRTTDAMGPGIRGMAARLMKMRLIVESTGCDGRCA